MPNNTPPYIDGNAMTFRYVADTDPFLRMKIDGVGKAAIAGAGEASVGVNWDGAVDISEDDRGTIRFDHQSGTQVYKANGAIAIGDSVYPAADGKVSALANGESLGKAVQATTADNDLIVVVPSNGGATVKFLEEAFAIGDFTDGGGASGFVDMASAIPARGLAVGWDAVVTTGFTGDTTAVAQVGVAGDVDRFSAVVSGSVLAVGTIGSHGPGGSGNMYCASATTPRLTVTGGADFTSIAAGALTLQVAYIDFAS